LFVWYIFETVIGWMIRRLLDGPLFLSLGCFVCLLGGLAVLDCLG